MTTVTGTNACLYIDGELFAGTISVDVDSFESGDYGGGFPVAPISGTIDLETKSDIDYLEIYLIILSRFEIDRVNLRRVYASHLQRIAPLKIKYRDFLDLLHDTLVKRSSK